MYGNGKTMCKNLGIEKHEYGYEDLSGRALLHWKKMASLAHSLVLEENKTMHLDIQKLYCSWTHTLRWCCVIYGTFQIHVSHLSNLMLE